MARAPGRTFSALPAGRGGSSTHPRTIARNRSRRALSPLSAEYERARANRGNRVSSKLRKLRISDEYNAANGVDRKVMEKAIRDKEEEVYQAERAKILEAYNARVTTREELKPKEEEPEGEEPEAEGEEPEGEEEESEGEGEEEEPEGEEPEGEEEEPEGEEPEGEEEESEEGELEGEDSDETMIDGFRVSQLYDRDAEEDTGGLDSAMWEDLEEVEEDSEEKGEQEYVEHEAGLAASAKLDMEQRRRYFERAHANSMVLLEQFARASSEAARARLRRQRQKQKQRQRQM